MPKQTFFWKNILIILALSLLFLVVALPRIFYPELNHGDEFADSDVLVSGANFARFGFIKTYFLPILEWQFNKPQDFYTHYPPLPQIINGILRMAFRTDSLQFFRIFALIFAFFNLLFWYLFIKKFSGSYLAGFLAAIFYLFNPFFIYVSDALGHVSSSDLLRSSIFFVFFVYLAYSGKRRRHLLYLLWALLVIEALASFEYIVYFLLFFILFRYFFKSARKSFSWKALLLLLSAPFFGFLLHFLQNLWYFQDFDQTMQDLRNIAMERMTSSKDVSADNFDFSVWWNNVIVRNFSLTFLFNYFILFFSIFFSYLLFGNLSQKEKKAVKSLLRLFLLLSICGISWYVLFPSHSFAHTYVLFLARHLLPAAALGFTIFIYIIWLFIKEKRQNNIILKILLGCLVVFILFTGIIRSDLVVGKDRVRAQKDFLLFKNCLNSLKEKTTQKDEIGVNYHRFPFMRYYTNRRFQNIVDRQSLESLKEPLKFFIFIPYENQFSVDLFQYLSQKYTKLFECHSGRFPSIFFELKK